MLKAQKNQKCLENEKKIYTFHQKGITLVALVITVIVMLILAGVGISVLTGGEGLFSKTKEAADKYNNAAKNEAEMFNLMMAGDWEELFTKKLPADGNFDSAMRVNAPDTSKLPKETTYYVTWNKVGPSYDPVFTTIPVMNWYNYNESKWANIKTTSADENLEAYWVWIPRFAYKLPESATAKTIEVAFVEGTGKTVVLENGTKEQGYYATDSEITTDNSGVYVKKTADAHTKWIIHPAFTFGDKQLSGIWVAKYEASSTNPTAANGGGNVTNQKVQVKPNVTSWRNITAANSFVNCRAIQSDGGALGTATGNTEVDTHMMKNMEWGAVAILSQSKYGYYNRETNTSLQVWNNPNSSYRTGTIGATSADQGSTGDISCYTYNTEQGIKASTTGNIYGIYDMAGGAWEQVAGTLNRPDILGTPEAKYYDLYTVGSYDGGKIGDMTRECFPASNVSWNGDRATFVGGTSPLFYRGGDHVNSTESGVFAFACNTGGVEAGHSFRPVVAVF